MTKTILRGEASLISPPRFLAETSNPTGRQCAEARHGPRLRCFTKLHASKVMTKTDIPDPPPRSL